ncbi:MAG: DNA polymerase III subunit alpha [Megamonas funiformis]|uniref:DNA polymerase III subunit alpha n=1 Tax=Megamonas funiformis TaxID=437897 RepID=UPI003992B938
MFTHLHVHSDHSLFDGYQTIDEILNRVKELGQEAVAITEHGTMASIIEFHKKTLEQDIKPIIGCEFYFCEDKFIKDRAFTHHLILLAKNETGYMNLKRLNKIAFNKDDGHFYFKPRIDSKELTEYSDGLICLSACLASIINTEDGEKWVQYFKNIFGDDFYLEVQPHPIDEQKEYNFKLLSYWARYKIKAVVTTDAHYSKKEDAVWHKKWIGLKKEEYYTTDTNYLWSEDELLNSNFLPQNITRELIKNTQEVTNKIEVYNLAPAGNHFPTYPINDACEKIKEICRGVWKDKVPQGHYKEYGDRFLYELSMLEKCGYTNYLLLTWDFLNWCKRNNIFTGIGRGSVSGSVVAWLLGIHHVDPIKYNLLFERFCNPERVSAPDIDNDLQTSRRGEAIDYLVKKYGNVMKIRTYSYLGNKAAIKRAGQVLGIDTTVVNDITKQIKEIDDIMNVKAKVNKEELITTAKHFYGRIGAFGSHASAILITPDDTINYAPIEYQSISDESLDGEKIWTQVASGDFHDLENFGLMKLDVLGLNTLDVIDNTLKQIKDKIDIFNLDINDKKVFKLYQNVDLLGCFQMDSPGMQKLAKDMKVNCFENVIALVALFRPGPLGSGLVDSYINGKNGGKIIYLCKEIEEVLSPTYNVIVYQEQVMLLAQKLAGYTLGQADMLRKIIGRKEEDKIEKATQDFKEAVIKHGFSKEIAEYIGNQIKAAGRYIFNKSHATAYGYLSYITAYLKVYYPKEFMCALINSKKDQKDVVPYMEECKRLDIKILPPDLRKGNLKWQVEKEGIRVGLTYIRNVGSQVDIIHYKDYQDVVEHNNKKITEGLIKAGAMDFLNIPRGKMLMQLVSMQDFLKRKNTCKQKVDENSLALENAKLKNDAKEIRKYERQLASWKEKLEKCTLEETTDWQEVSNCQLENEVLKFTFSEIPRVKDATIKQIKLHKDKKGKEMAFVVFSTNYREYNCTIFAKQWKTWRDNFSIGAKCKIACSNSQNPILDDFVLM